MNRRNFIKKLGLGLTVTGLTATGCKKVSNLSLPGTASDKEVPTDKMTYRITPTTGDKVSLLGYGCMRWPLMHDPDGKDGEEIIDQDAVNELVDYALAHGVNYFDTAPPYVRGKSEEATGKALSRHPRDSYYIATKMSNQHLARKGMKGKELFDASVEMYHDSMKKLQTDYIDYYLLHSCGGETGIPFLEQRFIDSGLLDFLMEERKVGRIRNLGFSYHGDVKVFDYLLSLHDKMKWDFVQIQLNYIDYRHASGRNFNAEYLYDELAKRNIPAVIMEPLLGGRLASLTDHLNARLKEREPEESIASWAFRFCGTFPNVLTVLSGMTYMEHLEDNIRTYAPLRPLNDEELAMLEDTSQIMIGYPSVPCTTCEYCMPCPYGINIPAIFSHYNKCINEGNVTSSNHDPNYAKARRAFLVGYDRCVPKLRQANHCIACNQCKPHCPQSIDIPGQLQRIDGYVEALKQNKEISV
ncbi:MAG: aldo/keto reductase [Muribaculaceae bacterium]|nr:aldo/keto reductase [Muribaculaceae bacterium]